MAIALPGTTEAVRAQQSKTRSVLPQWEEGRRRAPFGFDGVRRSGRTANPERLLSHFSPQGAQYASQIAITFTTAQCWAAIGVLSRGMRRLTMMMPAARFVLARRPERRRRDMGYARAASHPFSFFPQQRHLTQSHWSPRRRAVWAVIV